MSDYKIISLESLLAYRLSEMDFSGIYPNVINYGWGNETEVIKWIKVKDTAKQTTGTILKFNNNVPEIDYNAHLKYPLIWLNTPTDGKTVGGGAYFERVEIIITTNASRTQELNPVKWTSTIPLVTKIAQHLVDNLIGGRVRIEKINGLPSLKWLYFPEYTVAEYDRFDRGQGTGRYKGKGIDVWDAVKITLNLYANDDCLSEEELNNVLTCFKYNINQ